MSENTPRNKRLKEFDDLLSQLGSEGLIRAALEVMKHQDLCVLCHAAAPIEFLDVAHVYSVTFGITSEEPLTLCLCANCHRAVDLEPAELTLPWPTL